MNTPLRLLLTVSILGLAACKAADQTPPNTPPAQDAPKVGILTPEALHANPSIDGPRLKKPALSPDGKMVTVLQSRKDNAAQQDLWAYDSVTGEGRLLVSSTDLLGAPEILSEEEKNRRERAREYGSGIVAYSWAGETTLLFPLGGDIYIYDLKTKTSQQITATQGFETDAKVSESGKHVAYVRDNNLYVTTLATGLERQLTTGTSETIRNATASFVVQEELGRSTGYWWSPDDSRIAYTQIDESPIATEHRIEFGADGIKNIAQRYPFAGTPNANIKLAITDREGRNTIWADLGSDKDIYLTRAAWNYDGSVLYVGILARDHKTHKILAINPEDGTSKPVFTETQPHWINIRSKFKALKSGDLLFSSEQKDMRQIFKMSATGTLSAVTPDTLRVNKINCIDDVNGKVYFSGWHDSPLEEHIFSVSLSGENLLQITRREGQHSAAFSENCQTYVGSFSSIDQPSQTRIFANDGAPLAWLNENAVTADHPYAPFKPAHITPGFGKIPASDGTPLDYYLYKPEGLQPGEQRPAITLVYGGPGVQAVHKGWRRKAFPQMLAQQGYVVFQLDNRGATNRGKKFEDHVYRAMGQIEVTDQSTGAEWLKSQDFVDPDKMGIFGWSYGGYMTLHMLAQTDHYASGVSGAPVTDWALYDTAYTERYLGDPNPGTPNYTKGAYEKGSVFPFLEGLTEPVLLMHGMADDNVVFRHSIKLMDEMQKQNAQNLRLMTYPGEKHGFRQESNKIHRDQMILDFFDETLRQD